jgi:tetratricopeptide (TPR) repeat protein
MHSAIDKGNRRYHSGEHKQALDEYLKAGRIDSTSAVPHFNAGDALYRLEDYSEGAKRFLQAAGSSEDSIASMSYYNLGNAMFRAGDIESAVEAYKRALLIEPDDEDAKYNLELAMKLLEQQSQQKDDQPQQDNGEQDKAQQDQQNKQRPEDQEQQEQQERDQQSQQNDQGEDQQEQPPPQSGDEQQADAQPQPKEISPEELERIMAAIEASDRSTQEQLLKQKSRRRRVQGKDW